MRNTYRLSRKDKVRVGQVVVGRQELPARVIASRDATERIAEMHRIDSVSWLTRPLSENAKQLTTEKSSR